MQDFLRRQQDEVMRAFVEENKQRLNNMEEGVRRFEEVGEALKKKIEDSDDASVMEEAEDGIVMKMGKLVVKESDAGFILNFIVLQLIFLTFLYFTLKMKKKKHLNRTKQSVLS